MTRQSLDEKDETDQGGFAPVTSSHSNTQSRHHSHSLHLHRSSTRGSHSSHHHHHNDHDDKEHHRDPNLDINLPYRTLTNAANLDEYRVEVPGGEIPGPLEDPVAAAEEAEDLAAGRVTTHAADEPRYRLVTFEPNDPENPKNWPKWRKWYCTMVVSMTCFVVAFSSSVVTADMIGVAKEFHVSDEVVLLTITLFVIGFGVGPLVFAPLSEVYGRWIIYTSTLLIAVVFIIPCARAQNIGTLLVCRLIDGIAFSAPMTLVGGTLADMWRPEERGVPMATFSAAPFMGPVIGPLVGGFLSDAAGWRWLYYIILIMAGVVWVVLTFTVPETYAPTILKRRAAKKRKQTGCADYITEQDLDKRPFSERLLIFLIRPMQLLFRELIVFLISIYMSILYGLLYMYFVAYPIVFQEGKGYTAGITGLMFIPVAVGVLIGVVFSPMINNHYVKISQRFGGKPPAEYRLIPMMYSCWAVPIGLFIFAWTSYPRLTWVGPALAGIPVGFGFVFIYNSANNYIVDSYQHQAASALAAKTFLRSMWGAAVVLFTTQMYHRLNYQWASTLIAFISLACCAIPYLFWFYGARIRKRSHYAYGGDDEEEDSEGKSGGEKTSDSDPELGGVPRPQPVRVAAH